MTVEMERPFVWPKVPENFDQWDKSTFDAAQKSNKETQESYRPDAVEKPSKERQSIAQQAQALLQGEDKWRPTATQWEDVGEAREVETDVRI